MIIPYNMLSEDTLINLIEDFVTRDGTDNGDDTPLSERIKTVKYTLSVKQAFIVFDQETQTCALLLKQDIPIEWLSAQHHLLESLDE